MKKPLIIILAVAALVAATLVIIDYYQKPKIDPQKAKLLKYLPQSTGLVTEINFQNLITKSQIDKTKKIGDILGEITSFEAKTFAANMTLADLGIDFESSAYLFIYYAGNKRMINFMAKIGDSKMLKNNFESISDSMKIVKAENYHTISEGSQEPLAAFNDDILIFSINSQAGKPEANFSEIFKSNDESSLLTDDNFAKFASTKKDLGFWTNLKKFDMILDKLDMYKDVYIAKSLFTKDNYISGTVDFEDSKIVANIDFDFTPELLLDFAKMGRPINKNDMKKCLSAFDPKDVISISATSQNIKSVYSFLNKNIQSIPLGSMGLLAADAALKEKNLSLEKIIDAIDGSIVQIAVKSESKDLKDVLSNESTHASFVKLKNPETIKQFLEFIVEKNHFPPADKNGVYTWQDEFAIFINDDYLVIALEDNIFDKFGKFKELPNPKYIPDTSDLNSYYFVELKNIDTINHFDIQGLEQVKKKIESIQVSSRLNHAEIIVNMVDKNKNSLKALSEDSE